MRCWRSSAQPHLVLARDVLEAVDGSDDHAVGVAQRRHIDASHPALSVRVLNHRLGALEAFAREHRTRHRRVVGRNEVAFQALEPERAAEPLRGIEQPRGPAPKLDRALG